MMNHKERKSAITLALIMTFRMLGLFMILPVFMLYAQHLSDSTPALIGLALGVYGFTQACLQLPFGILSDTVGRKKIMVLGLILFASGSVVAAVSTSIYGVIIGRALQGAGAIGSTTIALLADLTRVEERTKAMAIVGSSIGFAFALAMVGGPLLNQWIGVSGIFWLTFLLALAGIAVLLFLVPNPYDELETERISWGRFKRLLSDRRLLKLDLSIFIQHAILTASFIAVPVALQQWGQLKETEQWRLYLPVLLFAYIVMIPFIVLAEKKGKHRILFLGSILGIVLSQLWLILFHTRLLHYGMALFLFFTAFTLLEAVLPSTISKMVPPQTKGAAMGIYSTLQFLGIFAGGALGGIIFGLYNIMGVFIFCTLLSILWLIYCIIL